MYANHGVLLVALGAALASLASAPPALFAAEPVPVSYTHLTLPTIYSV